MISDLLKKGPSKGAKLRAKMMEMIHRDPDFQWHNHNKFTRSSTQVRQRSYSEVSILKLNLIDLAR